MLRKTIWWNQIILPTAFSWKKIGGYFILRYPLYKDFVQSFIEITKSKKWRIWKIKSHYNDIKYPKLFLTSSMTGWSHEDFTLKPGSNWLNSILHASSRYLLWESLPCPYELCWGSLQGVQDPSQMISLVIYTPSFHGSNPSSGTLDSWYTSPCMPIHLV